VGVFVVGYFVVGCEDFFDVCGVMFGDMIWYEECRWYFVLTQ